MSLDLTKSVDDILKEAKTAELQDVKTALKSEKDKGDEARKGVIDGLQKLVDAAETPKEPKSVAKEVPAHLKGLKKVTVHVNSDLVASGAAFYDREQKVSIRAEAVSVFRTRFIQQKLANEELVEA